MSYDFEKKYCDKCGKEKDDNGFFLDGAGGCLCSKCHKKEEIKYLYELMYIERLDL